MSDAISEKSSEEDYDYKPKTERIHYTNREKKKSYSAIKPLHQTQHTLENYKKSKFQS
jgi:hypothetical protein